MNTSALTTRFFKTSFGPSIWILAQFGPKFNVITMIESTKVPCPENFFFRENRKTRRAHVRLYGHVTFVQLTPALTMTIIDKITIIPMTQTKHDLPWQ